MELEGFWIFSDIIKDKNLNLNEKFYLSILKQHNYNYSITEIIMSNQYNKQTISKIKKSLIKKGYIDNNETHDAWQAKLNVLLNKDTGIKCEWCGIKTNAIQEHHFPITKANGGKNIVRICPNCHSEFHKLYKGE